ncbi:hypothetical protein [Saccharibacillus sp. JS10]|uniref:hypothetical protein n=1 Tax=Saccharibacillus sp. JS10 TaxID=2950552 RepID=UPI00210E0337|nr:hypothetical protein [Saccharibacillus sp. JS10]MCQ4085866.1 hypothetical protein [Saccharibacillus sp. JS10]
MSDFEWKCSEKIQKKYIDNKEEKYYKIDLGIQKVNPQEIIALSRSLDDEKLERLRERVKEEGWIDKGPQTILLWKLPNKKLVVSGEGNHRAYFCKTEGIEEIKATLSLIVDISKLTEKQQELLDEKEKNYFAACTNYMNCDDSIEEKELLKLLDEADKDRYKFLQKIKLI